MSGRQAPTLHAVKGFLSVYQGSLASWTFGFCNLHGSLIKSRTLKSWKQAGECSTFHIWPSTSVPRQGFHFFSCRKGTQHQAAKPDNRSEMVPSCLGALRSSDLAFAQSPSAWNKGIVFPNDRDIAKAAWEKLVAKTSPCIAATSCFIHEDNSYLIHFCLLQKMLPNAALQKG